MGSGSQILSDNQDAVTELVTALTLSERMGLIDFNGHGSVRLPGGAILINSGASTRSALTADDIVAIDADGTLIDGGQKPPMELHIHTEIYRRRPDVRAILHGHPESSTLLTSSGTVVLPVFAQGCLMHGLPVHPTPESINTKANGERVAEELGGARGILLRAHGSIVVGTSLSEAFVLAVYLEQNCARQIKASPLGAPYVFGPDEIAAAEANLYKPNLFAKCWNYYRAKFEV